MTGKTAARVLREVLAPDRLSGDVLSVGGLGRNGWLLDMDFGIHADQIVSVSILFAPRFDGAPPDVAILTVADVGACRVSELRDVAMSFRRRE